MCVKYLLEKYWGSGKQKNMKRSNWIVLNVFKISSYFLSQLSHSKLFSFSFFFFLTRKTCEINPADVRNIPSSVFRFDNTYKHVSFKHRADVEKTRSRIFKQVKAVTSWVNARKRAREKRKRERKEKKRLCSMLCDKYPPFVMLKERGKVLHPNVVLRGTSLCFCGFWRVTFQEIATEREAIIHRCSGTIRQHKDVQAATQMGPSDRK